MKLFIFLTLCLYCSSGVSASFGPTPLKYSKYLEIYKSYDSYLIKFKRSPGNFKTQCIQIGAIRDQFVPCDTFFYFSKPLTSIGISSATFYGFIKELGAEENIKLATSDAGVPLQNITLVRLPEGIKQYLNSKIEVFLSFSYGDAYFNKEKNIEKLKVPVIYLNEFVESHPLARAEWIKVFGIILGKTEISNQVFERVEKAYLSTSIKSKLRSISQKFNPKVIYGDLNSQSVAIIDSDNFFYHAFRDLSFNLVNGPDLIKSPMRLKNTKLEYVYKSLIDSDFWVNTNSLVFNQSNLNNKKIKTFKCFLTNNIYTLDLNKNSNYWTTLSVRPDLILQDLFNIVWGNGPEKLSYFKKL